MATMVESWKVEEEEVRKRAVMVPETKPAIDTPESTPNAEALLRSLTVSACFGGKANCYNGHETLLNIYGNV